MTAVELLAECQARSINLQAHGGQLNIDAPAGALTDELLQRLRDCKPALLALLALLSDGGGYEREERAAIAWCENGPAHEVDAALWAAIDGFEHLYRGEGLEPLDLDAHGDAAELDLDPTAAPRPRSAVPVAVEWPGEAADFCLLLTADDLPPVPFRLNGWTQVTDAAKMLRSLRADILLRGPSGPRAFLQADLLELRRFALAAHSARVGSSDDAFPSPQPGKGHNPNPLPREGG